MVTRCIHSAFATIPKCRLRSPTDVPLSGRRHPPAVDSWDRKWEPADELDEALKPYKPRRTGVTAAGVITGILVAVLVAGGLFVIGLVVLFISGMSHWGSNK